MTVDVHFDERDWERLERDWSAWWAGALHRPLVMIEDFVHPGGDFPEYDFWEDLVPYQYPLEVPVDTIIDRFTVQMESLRFYGDAWPRWWPNFGPGIAVGFVGARVIPYPNTTWFEPEEETPLSRLSPTYDPDNVWWQRVQAVTEGAVERWGDQVCVGHTDLGGNLDILASLVTTEKLLYQVIDQPEEVARLVGEITHLWLRYYDELYEIVRQTGRGTTPWARIWSPGRTYMLQSDFSYMISPQMFADFVLPDLEACCTALDHSFYHLDGKGQIPHLDLLLELEALDGIQWIPGAGAPPPHEWLPLLARIRDGGKRCQVYVSPEGARQIVRELGGEGFALYIDEAMNESDAQGFLRLLQQEDRLLTV